MKTRSSAKSQVEKTPKVQEEPNPDGKSKQSRKRTRQITKEEKPKDGKEEENKPNEVLQCGICLEEVKIRGKLNACDHPFCFECIEQWSKTANTCPFCKGRFTSLDKIDSNEPKKKAKKIKVKHADQHYEWEGPQSYLEFEDHPYMSVLSNHLHQFVQATMHARAFGLLNPYAGIFSDDDEDILEQYSDSDDDDLLDEDDDEEEDEELNFSLFPRDFNTNPLALAFLQNLVQMGSSSLSNHGPAPTSQFQNTSDSPIDLTQENDEEEESPEVNHSYPDLPPLLVDSDSD